MIIKGKKVNLNYLRSLKSRYKNKNHAIHHLDPKTFVDLSYRFILRREPDPDGQTHYLSQLKKNKISYNHLLDQLTDSEEFNSKIMYSNMGTSIHQSRVRFLRGLPKAEIIVDLGGSDQGSDNGAMVQMGYPYRFKKLTIVDLPNSERHKIYQKDSQVRQVSTYMGPVEYFYQSMTNLQPIMDDSVDLVYSGQSIEHVTVEDAQLVYKEVMRVLKPGGYFCLDTPNGRLTRIQQDELIDPDHEIEYTHHELSTNLNQAGFTILEAKGLNYAGDIKHRSEFSETKIASNCGIYSDIENCYILAYICQKSPLTNSN